MLNRLIRYLGKQVLDAMEPFWGEKSEVESVLGTTYAFEADWDREGRVETKLHVMPPSGQGFLSELRGLVSRLPLSSFGVSVEAPTSQESSSGVADVYPVFVDRQATIEGFEKPLMDDSFVGVFLDGILDAQDRAACSVVAGESTAP